MRVSPLIFLLVFPAVCFGADAPGRWVTRNDARSYVLNPQENAAFIDRSVDLAVAKYYHAPLARLGLSADLREKVLAVLQASHRRMQRMVLDDLWESADKESTADRTGWKPGVKKEYAGQVAALKALLGDDGYGRFLRSLVDLQLEKESSAEHFPAADAEKVRAILRKHLLDAGGLPLQDQSAGLAALKGEASSLTPEGSVNFLRRWNDQSFPFSVPRPLVAIPGNRSSYDPALLK